MAGGDGADANDVAQLEAMRKDDFSWHPCEVSLCMKGIGLIVKYLDNDLDETITNREEVLLRIRFRSVPLEGNDCSLVQEGHCVLATQKVQAESLSFDAKVEKALRVRHSKKIHCRCTFAIKWLHQNPNGETFIVPSGAIMNLATKSINVHPTIFVFFHTLESSSGCTLSSLPSVLEGFEREVDMHELLEKQIEKISNSTDAYGKKVSEDILFGIKDKKGHNHKKVAAPKSDYIGNQVPSTFNDLKRSTRSRNKMLAAMEVKDSPLSAPSTKEESKESRSPLNPLAARAALASLMSKFPRNISFSSHDAEGKADGRSSGIAYEHSPAESPEKDPQNFSISATIVPMHKNIVKALFSNENGPEKPQHSNEPSEAWLNNEAEKQEPNTEAVFCVAEPTCSTVERKRSQPTEYRITRSTVHKSDEPCENVKVNCDEERKSSCSMKRRRFTRSEAYAGKEIARDDYIEDNISAKHTMFIEQNVEIQQGTISGDEQVVARPTDARSGFSLSAKIDNCKRKNKNDSKRRDVMDDNKSVSIARKLTRSTLSAETGKNSVKYSKELEESRSSDGLESGLFKGNTTPDSYLLEMGKSTTTPLVIKIYSAPPAEANTKKPISSAGKTTKTSKEFAVETGQCCRGMKKNSSSSKQIERRFSPRLRFLPRTRSQSKRI